MDNTKARSLNTKLKDRTLWYDGASSYTPTQLLQAIKTRDVKHVTEMTPMIEQYNRHALSDNQITVKIKNEPLSLDWTIPDVYKTLNVVKYLSKAHELLFEGIDPEELLQREERLVQELVLYRKYGLFDVLRAIIWIINTLTAKDTVWGVGRGSSVSSYVLFVIGVHDVDSFAYGLDIDDFLHE